MISAFFSLLAAIALVLPQGDRAGAAPPPAAAARASDGPTVLAGTGDVAPSTVDRVRRVVDDETPRVRAIFGGEPSHGFTVFVHADRESMPEALVAQHHPGSPGFALLGQHQIHLVWAEMGRLGTTLRGVVVHELVHELLDQYVEPHGRRIPRWFHEGLAQTIAGDTYLGASEEDLVWPLGAGRLPSFGDLRGAFPTDPDRLRLAYAQSYSYVAWLVHEFGLHEMLAVARAVDERTSFENALSGRVHLDSIQIDTAWRGYVLHGSGAPWRVVFDQCFTLLMIAALPLLVLALMRRLRSEERAAATMRARERLEAQARAADPPPADAAPPDPTPDGPSEPRRE